MKKLYRRLNIQQKIMGTFSILIVVTFLLQLGVYNIYLRRVIRSKANDYILETLKQTNSKLDTYLDTIRIMSNLVISNEAIRNTMAEHSRRYKQGENMGLSYEDNLVINNEIAKLTLPYDNIHSLQIYTPYYTVSYNFASVVGSTFENLNAMERLQLESSDGELVLLPSRRETADRYYASQTIVFSGVRKIYDYKTRQLLGYVFINIHETALRDIIEDVAIGTSGEVYLFKQSGLILSSLSPDRIGASIEEGMLNQINANGNSGYFIDKGTLTAWHISESSGWGIIAAVPASELASEMEGLQYTNLVIGVLGLALALIASYFLSKGLTKPIQSLVQSMQKTGDGDLPSRVPVYSDDEFGHLNQVYNQMTEELQQLIWENYEIQLSNKEAQLQAIQAQINPHFLYNTLDTLYWMLILHEEEELGELVISLSDILRYSISKSRVMVLLKQEIHILETYRLIQDARFANRLEWVFEIAPETENLFVPRMLLQPIVENAIIHGMDCVKPVLKIIVRSFLCEDSLIICVTDDGKGMSEEKIREVLTNPRAEGKHTGLGLAGVNRRLGIRFGENAALKITSAPGEGTRVEVWLPVILQTEQGGQECAL